MSPDIQIVHVSKLCQGCHCLVWLLYSTWGHKTTKLLVICFRCWHICLVCTLFLSCLDSSTPVWITVLHCAQMTIMKRFLIIVIITTESISNLQSLNILSLQLDTVVFMNSPSIMLTFEQHFWSSLHKDIFVVLHV